MEKLLQHRAISLGKYILKTNQTVRQTAIVYGISKSTVHYDVSHRLKKLDWGLYVKVNKLLKNHFEVKHIRGGEATKKKYYIMAIKK